MNIVILDLEWNGAYSRRLHGFINEIIEFGAVKLDAQLNITDRFSCFVKPQVTKKISAVISDLTNITDANLLDARPYMQVMSRFKKWAGDCVIATWGTSDILALIENCRYFGGGETVPFLQRYVDLQQYVEKRLDEDGKEQLGLSKAAELLSIDDGALDHHRALDDSVLSAMVLERIYTKDTFRPFIQDCKDPEFYRRITFKTTYICDVNSPLIEKEHLHFTCEKCGGEAKRRGKWTVKNKSLRSTFKCEKCGYVALPEDQLPLLLPEVESYETTDDGESPLSAMTDWVNTTCPCCGGPAQRETDTMPQWAGSSWYFLRYMDPHNDKAFASKEALDYWGQVDWYNGGMEHTTLHLLYSRFWNNFLHDIGVVPNAEPYHKRTSHGMILGKNPHYVGNVTTQEEKDALIAKYGNEALRPAVKMSKSLGNVVNPDDVIKAYGADTMRLYIMFIGDFEKTATWSDDAVKGCKRFLDRIWNLHENCTDSLEYTPANEPSIHKAIKKVSDDIEAMKFNTAIATMMSLVNDFYANGVSKGDMKALLVLLSPFAPHIAEEMWEHLGFEGMACEQAWPEYDQAKTVAAEVQIAVQVAGKVRANVVVPSGAEDDEVVAIAMADSRIQKQAEGKELVKQIVVRAKDGKIKLVNLIFKPAK